MLVVDVDVLVVVVDDDDGHRQEHRDHGADVGDVVENKRHDAEEHGQLDLDQHENDGHGHAGTAMGATGHRITALVQLGIGGSHLGPALAVDALRHHAHPDLCDKYVLFCKFICTCLPGTYHLPQKARMIFIILLTVDCLER